MKVTYVPLRHSHRTSHNMAVRFSSLNALHVSMMRNPQTPVLLLQLLLLDNSNRMYLPFFYDFHPTTDMLRTTGLFGLRSGHHQKLLCKISAQLLTCYHGSDAGLLAHPYQVSHHKGAVRRPGSTVISSPLLHRSENTPDFSTGLPVVEKPVV